MLRPRPRTTGPAPGRARDRNPARALAVLLPLLLAGCASLPIPIAVPTPAPPASGSATAPDPELARQIHALVNRHRLSLGLTPLVADGRLEGIARDHSRAMASRRRPFGHDAFDARSSEIAAFLPLRSMAENVAYDGRTGARLAELVVQGWLGSPGHRRNIEGSFQVSGVGVSTAPDGLRYVTQIFVSTQR